MRHFEVCLDVVPYAPTATYNLACARTRLGDLDGAFATLEDAIRLGLDATRDRLGVMVKDLDLAPLRADPRFPDLLRRWNASRAALVTYQETPASYVPPRLRGAESWPLVVVLHARGATKDDVVSGPWRALADELGFALLAPSGRVSLGEDPRDGMTWIGEEPDTFETRATEYALPVERALEAFHAAHPIDKERVVIVGEGVGALVASTSPRTPPICSTASCS